MCYVGDNGRYIIPSDMLQQLPVLEHWGYLSCLIISMTFGDEIQAPLTREGHGKLQVLSINNFRINYAGDFKYQKIVE